MSSFLSPLLTPHRSSLHIIQLLQKPPNHDQPLPLVSSSYRSVLYTSDSLPKHTHCFTLHLTPLPTPPCPQVSSPSCRPSLIISATCLFQPDCPSVLSLLNLGTPAQVPPPCSQRIQTLPPPTPWSMPSPEMPPPEHPSLCADLCKASSQLGYVSNFPSS